MQPSPRVMAAALTHTFPTAARARTAALTDRCVWRAPRRRQMGSRPSSCDDHWRESLLRCKVRAEI